MLDFKGKFAAVLPAGGLGKRMGGNIPKQLMVLGGKPVYRYSLETFLSMEEIAEVVMAVPAEWKDHFEKEICGQTALRQAQGPLSPSELDSLITNKLKIVVGGAERWQSVENGVNALTSGAEYVLVHDVARPFISKEIILDVCKTLVEKGCCLVAKPAVDTIKIAKDGRLLSCRIHKCSGMPSADHAALKAVELTAPFRPLPADFKGQSIDIQFTFDYNVFNASRY